MSSGSPVNPDHQRWIGPIRRIQNKVCLNFGISYMDMISARRDKRVIPGRHIAMWLSRKMTLASLPAIAMAFKRGDHTTIIHGIKNADAMMRRDGELRDKVNDIFRELSNGD